MIGAISGRLGGGLLPLLAPVFGNQKETATSATTRRVNLEKEHRTVWVNSDPDSLLDYSRIPDSLKMYTF